MTKALVIKDLCKTYENGFQALKGISLEVDKGDFFALLGPNGAGKSTAIGVLCSLVRKTSGFVSIMGHDIDKSFSAAKKQLGLVPQEFNFNIFEPVQEIIANQGGYYGLERKFAMERAEHCLNELGLWEKRFEQARNLSGGMKRRLMIARALVHSPEFLILDEPTAGVDIEIRRSMWSFLRRINEQGTTIILTTHYLEEAESLCRNIAIIDEGCLVANTSMKELLSQLHTETLVLDLQEALMLAPEFPDFNSRLLDATTLEVDIDDSHNVNQLFSCLNERKISVRSLRSKSNRLEELFMNLVESKPAQQEQST